MGRAGRAAVIFLVLVVMLSLLGAWQGLALAGPVACGALFVLLVVAGLWWRGRTLGFTRAEKRRIFGQRFD